MSPRCPLDRTPINRDNRYDVSPAPLIVKNIADELQVKCVYYSEGCEWIGGRCDVKFHLERDCKSREVECTCGVLVKRLFFEDGKCPHQLVNCNFCHSEMVKMELDTHLYEACEENLVECAGCRKQVTAKVLKTHRKECDGVFVSCSAQVYGCKWKGSEKALTTHEKDCALNSLVAYFESQEEKTDAVSKENLHLKRQMDMIMDGVVGGRMDTSHAAEVDCLHLIMEMERMQLDVDSLRRNDNGVVRGLVNDCMALKDEVSSQRAIIHSLRMQLQFLILERRTEVRLNNKL